MIYCVLAIQLLCLITLIVIYFSVPKRTECIVYEPTRDEIVSELKHTLIEKLANIPTEKVDVYYDSLGQRKYTQVDCVRLSEIYLCVEELD